MGYTRWMFSSLALVGALSLPTIAHSQEPVSDAHDEEARAVFAAGETAFGDARYEDALGYFQRAYELSDRPVLLYNVGVAADRLRRDEVALDAFERFLSLVAEHPRRRDVEARVIVLRAAIAERASPPAEDTTATAASSSEASATIEVEPAPAGVDMVSVIGASGLGALGLSGLVAGIVGIAGGGSCIDTSIAGACIEEETTNWLAVGIYGGLGLAALTGAIVWLIVAVSDGETEDVAVMTPTGPAFRLEF